MARIIRKYENRRLYDTEASKYVNLDGVAQLIREGHEVQVLDAKTGDDLTRSVLSQIIVEGARGEGGPPLDFLRELIRSSDRAQRDFLHWYLGKWADAWKSVQEGWRPPSGAVRVPREILEKVLDPFGAWRAVLRAQEKAAPEAPLEPARAGGSPAAPPEDTAASVAELRRRLEELEARLRAR